MGRAEDEFEQELREERMLEDLREPRKTGRRPNLPWDETAAEVDQFIYNYGFAPRRLKSQDYDWEEVNLAEWIMNRHLATGLSDDQRAKLAEWENYRVTDHNLSRIPPSGGRSWDDGFAEVERFFQSWGYLPRLHKGVDKYELSLALWVKNQHGRDDLGPDERERLAEWAEFEAG